MGKHILWSPYRLSLYNIQWVFISNKHFVENRFDFLQQTFIHQPLAAVLSRPMEIPVSAQ
jgi:hypothetical protein